VTRLAFVSTGAGSADVYNMVSGGTPTLLVGGANSAEITPAFSPDGTQLSYSSNANDGNTELYLLQLATGSVTRLTNRALTDGAGTWSPDGKYIIYLAYTGSGTDNQLRWIRPSTGATGTIPLAGTGVVLRPHAVPRY
jgi:TolB protein